MRVKAMDGRKGNETRKQASYWRRVLRVTAALVALWAGVTVFFPWLALELPDTVAGFPLGYWVVAQGALLIYLAIVVGYAMVMERMDARYRGEEPAQPQERTLG